MFFCTCSECRWEPGQSQDFITDFTWVQEDSLFKTMKIVESVYLIWSVIDWLTFCDVNLLLCNKLYLGLRYKTCAYNKVIKWMDDKITDYSYSILQRILQHLFTSRSTYHVVLETNHWCRTAETVHVHGVPVINVQFKWRFSTAWYGTVRHGSVRYGTAQFGSVAFPPQFSTAIEWAGLFTRRYNCAASTAVTSS